jgi:hypothetical protein
MIENTRLPGNLITVIGSESKEFAVKAGRAMLAGGIRSLFRKGGYFVGTSTRLIHSYKGKIRSIDWEQFSGAELKKMTLHQP